MKQLLALLLAAFLLLGLLAGCSAASKTADSAAYDQATTTEANSAMSAPTAGMDAMTDMVVTEDAAPETPMADSTAETEEGESETLDPEAFTEKIIYSGYVCLQTTAFDDTLAQLEEAVANCGGFVQDSSVDGSTRTMAVSARAGAGSGRATSASSTATHSANLFFIVFVSGPCMASGPFCSE